MISGSLLRPRTEIGRARRPGDRCARRTGSMRLAVGRRSSVAGIEGKDARKSVSIAGSADDPQIVAWGGTAIEPSGGKAMRLCPQTRSVPVHDLS